MSGPKVVRVRTREELAAECHASINALRAAIQNFEAFARNYDFLDKASIQRRSTLIEELAQKVEAGEFDTVRRICSAEIEAVSSEREHVEEEVLRRAAQEASRRRRCQYLAASLAKNLQLAGRAVPAEIEAARRGRIGETDEELRSLEAVVSRALADQTLASVRDNDGMMTEEQRRLASLLIGDEAEAAVPAGTYDRFGSAFKRLDRAIAEVRTLDATPTGSVLLRRMQAVLDEPDFPQTAMRIDSLVLEWTQRRRTLREIADKQIRAKQLVFELARLSDAQARELAGRLVQAAGNDLDAVIAHAQKHLEQKTRETAASQRRGTVLKGLATLGYEVGSELSTAWAQQGRIIVQKPDRPGYGIELSGPPDANQMQVKVVAFAAPGLDRDAARDRDAEVLWCSEFGKLQHQLGREGTSINVVRALGVGAVPVPQVEDLRADERDRDTEDRTRDRTHR